MAQEYIYVYGDATRVKVGRSRVVAGHINSHRTSNPHAEFIAAVAVGNPGTVEKRIHRHFKDYRVGNEWFEMAEPVKEWLDWFVNSPNVVTDLSKLDSSWPDDACMPWSIGTFPEGMLPLRGVALHAPTPPRRASTSAGIETSSDSQDWYTPPDIIHLARTVLGHIDLDPMSCAEANHTVQADRIFTEENDGMKWPWSGRVWLNPPYGGAQIPAVEKLLQHYRDGDIEAAIVCLNSNSTTTKWFAPLFDFPLCFPDYRIDFTPPGGPSSASPSKGAVLVYLGRNVPAFAKTFGPLGAIVARYAGPVE